MASGKTPSATKSEKRLAQLGREMAQLSGELQGGREYMLDRAQLDKSERYEEQALSQVYAAEAGTMGGNPQNQVVDYDTRDRVGLGAVSEATSEQQQAAVLGGVAGADLGVQGAAAGAEYKMGLDVMAENAAREAARQQKSANIQNAIGTGVGMYLGMNGGKGPVDSKAIDAEISSLGVQGADKVLASGDASFIKSLNYTPKPIKDQNLLGQFSWAPNNGLGSV